MQKQVSDWVKMLEGKLAAVMKASTCPLINLTTLDLSGATALERLGRGSRCISSFYMPPHQSHHSQLVMTTALERWEQLH